jgi:hypothetical protein
MDALPLAPSLAVIHQLATDHSPITAPPGAVAFYEVHGGGRPRGRGDGAESPDRRVMAD